MSNLMPPMQTWTDVGNFVGIAFAVLALLTGIIGFATDWYRVAYRRRIVAEAREMVRIMTKARKPE